MLFEEEKSVAAVVQDFQKQHTVRNSRVSFKILTKVKLDESNFCFIRSKLSSLV